MHVIERATINDIGEINRIYNQGILLKSNAYDQELSIQEQKEWFEIHEEPLYPVFVARHPTGLKAWLSVSPYRKGRKTLSISAEISYYVDEAFYRQGLASALIRHAEQFGREHGLLNFFAIVLEYNEGSIRLLEKEGYEKWGFLPKIALIEQQVAGQYYYGKQLVEHSFEKYKR